LADADSHAAFAVVPPPILGAIAPATGWGDTDEHQHPHPPDLVGALRFHPQGGGRPAFGRRPDNRWWFWVSSACDGIGFCVEDVDTRRSADTDAVAVAVPSRSPAPAPTSLLVGSLRL